VQTIIVRKTESPESLSPLIGGSLAYVQWYIGAFHLQENNLFFV
jgi:hypothetical protein